MTPSSRTIKRLTIVVAYIVIFGLVGTGLYFLFRTKPTCTDKIQNQGETGVDCGGPCAACAEMPKAESLKVVEKAIVPGETGKYDALVKIVNPNSLFGSAKFDYSFNLLDGAGKIIAKSAGSNFVLPGQTKYILAFNIPSDVKPESLDFEISSFEWSKFSQFEEPDITVYAKEFSLASGGESGFARLTAKMKNQSGFDFHEISAAVVIRGGDGSPIAINQTNFNDVRAGEEREINVSWNSSFAIDPVTAKIEIVPEVNVFESDNFMKQHGVPGQYGTYNVSGGQQ
ncbi:MAG TPA: hypothetical protein VMQ48_03685 [Candidatus Saccharimonadales bacterium]|nr:hypothetical protein [Candidatus Saccharimonadales bacterium]